MYLLVLLLIGNLSTSGQRKVIPSHVWCLLCIIALFAKLVAKCGMLWNCHDFMNFAALETLFTYSGYREIETTALNLCDCPGSLSHICGREK